jgi:hypothetical protein
LPGYVASNIRSKTGFGVQMAEFSANPFTGSMTVRDLVLVNPEYWGSENFVELRELRVKTSVFSIFSGRYLADVVVIDVARVNLVRDKHGVLNALVFKDGLTGKNSSGPAGKTGPAKGFFIKKLVMKFDKLTLNDHSDLLPGTRTYHVKVDCELQDVDTVTKLLSPFSGTALGLLTDTIGNLFTGSTDLLKGTVKGTVKGTAGLIQDAGKQTGKTLKGLLDSLDKKKP